VTELQRRDEPTTAVQDGQHWQQFLARAPRRRSLVDRMPEPLRGYAMDRTASWHVLKVRSFRAYFIGSTVSNIGTWLQNTAQLLIVYRLTRSPLDIALVTGAQFAGFLTVGPWAGTIAARGGAKRVLVGTQFVSAGVAVALACLWFSHQLSLSYLVAGALVTGFATTLALPVTTTMISALVEPEDTKAALGMNSLSYNAGRTVAPVLCLILITTVGAGWAFALNAASFLVFAAAVAWYCPKAAISAQAPVRPRAIAAIAFHRPRIILLLAMVAAVTFADDPILVLGPSVAHRMAVPSFWPAYFLTALGVGTVLGALIPRRGFASAPVVIKGRPAQLAQTRRAAAPLAVLAVSVLIFTAGWGPWVSFAGAAMAGVAGLVAGSTAQALLLQIATPASALQVMALWGVAWAGTKPIASLLDGALATHLGVHVASAVLVLPALVIGGCELGLKQRWKKGLKARMSHWNGNAKAATSH
jgi:MFS family permease